MAEENNEAGANVLVVDDSRVIRVAAKKILKEEFNVFEAGDGESAWEVLSGDNDIALVISDLSMPYLDGMGLLKRLRQAEDKRLANIPVIIVTGAEDDEDAKSSAFAAGASDFISKPFDSVQLLAHTRSHIKLASTESKLEQTATAIESEPTIDTLTGLYNQRSFNDRGGQELAYAIRHRSELGLVFIDVDNFDDAFIKYGKPAGEAILKIFTKIIRENVRTEDTAGRVGLARFGLLLPSANSVGARKLAVRICQQIAARTFKIGDDTLKMTASAGVITPLIRRDTRLEELLEEAQRLLARAQKMGGKRVLYDQRDSTEGVPDTDTDPTAVVATAEAGSPSEAEASPTSGPGAGPPAGPAPEVASALAMLEAGQTEELAAHLPELVARVLPLLEAWDSRFEANVGPALEQIKAALASD